MSVQTEAQAVGSAAPPRKPIDPAETFRRLLMIPSVVPLLLWMIVPLAMAIVMSFLRYNLLSGSAVVFSGFDNYLFLAGDASFIPAIINTIVFIGAVLIISVVAGVLLAVLYDQDFYGKNVAMLLVIAPFFVMPTVSALVWKNMIMHPVNGLISLALQKFGLAPIDWFGDFPMISIIIIVSWEWVPFAFLILVTALKSLDQEQKEAAAIDGAGPLMRFWYIVLPHLEKAIGVVVMIETIFLLSIFAEIYITTAGGPGNATTTLAFLVYSLGLQQFDAGIASAGGILAVILANIVSIFLVRMLARNLKQET
ncbi:MAG TPA: sugar ABC transporter permease [Chthoniobacterales bacterium]|nr:sugar ABC transporter permease [Chthoniobacterales bacterium]